MEERVRNHSVITTALQQGIVNGVEVTSPDL